MSELVSSMVEAGGGLPLPEDRLLTIMEAAQVVLPATSHTDGGVLPGTELLKRKKGYKEKTTPFNVDLTRSLVIYQAAQNITACR